MGNIENYNKGAIVLGIKDTSIFQTADLIEGKKGPFINIINGLNQLGFLVQYLNTHFKVENIYDSIGSGIAICWFIESLGTFSLKLKIKKLKILKLDKISIWNVLYNIHLSITMSISIGVIWK